MITRTIKYLNHKWDEIPEPWDFITLLIMIGGIIILCESANRIRSVIGCFLLLFITVIRWAGMLL